ncbi:LOW QUALITY PROTEIN: fibroblast growth factor 2 [Neophocaena asiaeorientalis asiaeorientalis]|uniref:Fibroblast growth factor n=1 Tax=Neophocaena asiaeorientalis asiaeorientalis TaxID=1706337 RepID=A0A341BF24_NEOAA|nr:LOW QUALITY PROTEIN: fibroblast growth factor 2 [Neophocaena asiaeorientalis asiaeorientalis]
MEWGCSNGVACAPTQDRDSIRTCGRLQNESPRGGEGPERGLQPHPRTSPAKNAERVGGGAQEGRRTGDLRGWWAFAGGDVEDVTPWPGCCQTSGRCAGGCKRIPGAAASGGGPPERRLRRHPALTPSSRAARAAPGARGPRQGAGGAMAAGSITTLPALPEDGGSGAFPPGHFKDPKRLYCKNGGFFLRIHPDGRVDGVREKSDPHVKLQLRAEERGVVSIKGVCANRYLAMKEDGRLLASKCKCVTDECFFFERLESNNYNTYRSRKYSSWYVALKRTGQYKLGPKTGPGQKAILFLPMSAKS